MKRPWPTVLLAHDVDVICRHAAAQPAHCDEPHNGYPARAGAGADAIRWMPAVLTRGAGGARLFSIARCSLQTLWAAAECATNLSKELSKAAAGRIGVSGSWRQRCATALRYEA
jgi:hypothetical protein